MATLGSTSEPTTGAVYFGLNSTNHHAILLTMPEGGPWEITRLGAWIAGMDATPNARLCLWSPGGSLLEMTPQFAVSNGGGLAIGASIKHEADLETPYVATGGQQLYVGVARDPAEAMQFGTRSGTRLDKTSASWPTSLSGAGSVSGAIGAFIANYQSANVAPNAPTSLSPSGSAVVSSGTAPVLSGTRSDPDGDNMTYVQIIVYRDNGTTVVYDSGKVSDTGTTFARTVTLPNSHEHFKWKARTWDSEGLAGPYSAQQRFYANAVPSTPSAPNVTTDTLTPLIDGSFTDSGDTLAAVQIEVTDNASPYTSRWASGDITKSGASGSSWNQTYAGSALSYGGSYRARYRVKDSHGAYSSWSAWKTFTLTQPAGPSNLTPRTQTPRLTDLTPDLSIAHSALFQNDEIQVYAANSLTSTLLWNKAKEGADYTDTLGPVVRTYAGTALTDGQTVYWRARIELADGTDTLWSPLYPIQFNAAPSIPTGLEPTGGEVLSTLTPDLLATFADPDPGDTPLNADIEVQRVSDSAAMWTSNANTGFNADGVVTYAGTALVYETQYRWRVRFRDAAGLVGAYSAWNVFKVSQAPSASGVTPVGGAAVSESTPTLDWTFSSPGGKAQQAFRVRLFDKGPTGANYADEELVHDSGFLTSTATQYDVPFGILLDDHDYRWELTVRDTDLLDFVLA